MGKEVRIIVSAKDLATQTFRNLGLAAESAANKVDTFAQSAQRASLRATAVLTGMAFATAKVTSAAIDYERSMVRVKAVSQSNTAEFMALQKAALSYAGSTEYTARQVADGMQYMAMAGFKANQIIKATPSVLQLATAGMMDLGQAADITTNIMTGFGMQADELAGANDVLVSAMTGANVNLTQLGEAFKYAGPVAKAAGVQFETTAAAIALMGNAGIQGSMAGTALRGAITKLLNPTKEAQKVLTRLGIEVTDNQGNLKDFTQIITDLEKAGLTAGDAMTLFGQRAGPGMQAIIEQGSDALRTFIERLRESGGIAERIEQEQLQTLGGQLNILKSQFEAIGLTIENDVMLYTKGFVKLVQDLTAQFQGLSKEQRNQIEKWGAIAVATLGGVAAFGLVATAASIAAKGLLLVGKTFALISSPTILTLGLLAAGAAALYTAWTENWGGIQEKVEAAWKVIEPIFTSIGNWTSDLVTKLQSGDFQGAWTQVTDTLKTGWNALKDWEGWGKLWGWVVDASKVSWQFVKDSWVTLKSWEGWGDLWNWVVETTSVAWDFIKDSWTTISSWEGWSQLWSWVVQAATVTWDFVKESWNALKDWEGWGQLWTWIKDKSGEGWNLFKEAFPDVAGTTEMVVKATIQFTGDTYNAIKQGFETGDWSAAIGIGSDLWSKGAVLLIGAQLASSAVSGVLASLRKSFNYKGMAGKAGLANGLLIGAVSIGVQFAEGKAEGDYSDLAQNMVAALGAALVAAGLTRNKTAAVLTFDIILNLRLGSKISETLKKASQKTLLPMFSLWGGPITPIPGAHDGAILPGYSGPDKFPALLAPGEAVVPAKAVHGGLPAVAEWFRKMGVPGFANGYAPNFLSNQNLNSALNSASGWLESLDQGIADITKTVTDTFTNFFRWLGKALISLVEKLFPDLVPGLLDAWEKLMGYFEPEGSSEQSGTNYAAPFRVKDAQYARSAKANQTWWESVIGSAQEAWDGFAGSFGPFREAVVANEQSVKDLANTMSDLGMESADAVRGLQNILDLLSSIPDMALNISKGMKGIKNEISSMLGGGMFGNIAGGLGAAYLGATTFGRGSSGGTSIVGTLGGAMSVLPGPLGAIGGAMAGVSGLANALFPGKAKDKGDQELQQRIKDMNKMLSDWGASYQSENLWFKKDSGLFGWRNLFGNQKWETMNKAAAEEGAKIAEQLINSMTATYQQLGQGLGQVLFSSGGFEDFGKFVGRRLQQVLLEEVLASAAIQGPLQQLSAYIAEAVEGGFSQAELAQINVLSQTIFSGLEGWEEMANQIAEQFGLAEEAAESIAGTLRNMPSGFKITAARYNATLPKFHSGGYVPRDMVAELRKGEVVLTPEQAARGGDVINIYIGTVYGNDDLEQKLAETWDRIQSRRSFARYGLASGGGR